MGLGNLLAASIVPILPWATASAMKDHRGRRDRISRSHQRDLRIRDLIDCLSAELAHRLDRILHPVNVAFGQVAAAGIERKRAVGPHQLAVGYEWSALAAFAESQLLERHQN